MTEEATLTHEVEPYVHYESTEYMKANQVLSFKDRYLLVKLAEESGELTQASCKILNYGAQPKKLEHLAEEFADLLAMAQMLGIKPDRARIAKKVALHSAVIKRDQP